MGYQLFRFCKRLLRPRTQLSQRRFLGSYFAVFVGLLVAAFFSTDVACML